MSTMIAVPCMDQVPAQFAQSLATLQKEEKTYITFQIGSLIYTSRNNLAKLAIQYGVDNVIWFDSDMMFAPDTMLKLLKYAGRGEIVSGLYFRRVQPFTPVIMDKLEFEDGRAIWHDATNIPDEPFEVAGCGFGCVMTPTEILMDVQAKYGTLFTPINGTGEDLSFCWRARQLGYKIICDPSISLGHVGHHVITREFYENYPRAEGEE